MLKKLDELRDTINKPENQTAKSLAVLAAAAFGPKGTSKGLLDYQGEVDVKREKLQKKLDGRIATIQELLLSRNAAMGKEKSYGEQMGILSYRLAGADATRAEKFMSALANDPKQAQVVLNYIKEVESSRSGAGFELTANGILDAVRILETKSPELIENFKSSADIMEAILSNKQSLADDKIYYQTLQDASVTQRPTGQTLIRYGAIPTYDDKVKKAQKEQFDDRLVSMLNASKSSRSLQNVTIPFGANQTGLTLDAEGIVIFQTAIKAGEADYSQLYNKPEIILPVMKGILDDSKSETELRDFLVMNPSLGVNFLTGIQNSTNGTNDLNALLVDRTMTDVDFDKEYGRGAAEYIKSQLGDS